MKSLWIIFIFSSFVVMVDRIPRKGYVEVFSPTLSKIFNGEKADINLAELDEIEMIPGIGRETAKKIYSFIKERKVMSVDEIKVEGVGKKKLELLKKYFK